MLLVLGLVVIAWLCYYSRPRKLAEISGWAVPPVEADFKWNETLPFPYRPFVGKRDFKVNMGIRDISKTPEDWIFIENTYKKMTAHSKWVLDNHAEHTTFVSNNEQAHAAVREAYTKVVTFLVMRFPMYFKIKGTSVVNEITGQTIPRHGTGDANVLIRILAETIEEDMLILIKDDPSNKDMEYKVRAGTFLCPAGFYPSRGFDQEISFIHEPVPQYHERLKLGMHRFFNRLEPKDLWVRNNWLLQTDDKLYRVEGSHGRPGEETAALKHDDVDFDNVFLRVERQTFTRLPKSRADIMLIRTYLTPVKTLRDENLGDTLTHAIDSLPDDLAFYKRRHLWGPAVKQYMAAAAAA